MPFTLEESNLLSRRRSGFKPNSSSIHSLLTVYDQLIRNVGDGLYSCRIFFDLVEAHDIVNH